jgi:hypothetical protein
MKPKKSKSAILETMKKGLLEKGMDEENADKACKAFGEAYGEDDDDDGEGGDDKPEDAARKSLEAALDEINTGKHLLTQTKIDEAVAAADAATEDKILKAIGTVGSTFNLSLTTLRERLGNVEKVMVALTELESGRDEVIKAFGTQLNKLKNGFDASVDELKKAAPVPSTEPAPIAQPAVTAPLAVTPIPSPMDEPSGDAKVTGPMQVLAIAKDMLSKGGWGDDEKRQLQVAVRLASDSRSLDDIYREAPLLRTHVEASAK